LLYYRGASAPLYKLPIMNYNLLTTDLGQVLTNLEEIQDLRYCSVVYKTPIVIEGERTYYRSFLNCHIEKEEDSWIIKEYYYDSIDRVFILDKVLVYYVPEILNLTIKNSNIVESFLNNI
jgi:hypothetical protein